jgi:RNA polymerase sigma-54 factor
MVQEEEHSLSDSEIARRLKERGIDLARRTVAKYRAKMDMGSSYTR